MLLHYGSFLKQAQRTGWLEGLPGKRCLRYFQNCEMMVSNYILQALKSFHHHHHHHQHHHHHNHHHHPSPIIHHPSSIIHHPSSIIHHHHPSSIIIIIHHHPSIHPFLKQAQRLVGWKGCQAKDASGTFRTAKWWFQIISCKLWNGSIIIITIKCIRQNWHLLIWRGSLPILNWALHYTR